MMTITIFMEKLKSYIDTQLTNMGKANPVVGFLKPIISRALDKNLGKVSGVLDLISDKDGNIDIENILAEIGQNLMTTNPFVLKTPLIGDIEIGGGEVKLNLPLTNKRLVLNMNDLEAFKEMLITKD